MLKLRPLLACCLLSLPPCHLLPLAPGLREELHAWCLGGTCGHEAVTVMAGPGSHPHLGWAGSGLQVQDWVQLQNWMQAQGCSQLQGWVQVQGR